MMQNQNSNKLLESESNKIQIQDYHNNNMTQNVIYYLLIQLNLTNTHFISVNFIIYYIKANYFLTFYFNLNNI